MIRFAAMASIKRELVLGCFMLACTVLFIVFNPNRYSLGEWELLESGNTLSGRIDGLTGEVEIYTDADEGDIWGASGKPESSARWISFP